MKTRIGIIFTEVFRVSFILYLVLLIVDTSIPGAVSMFVDLNIFLGIVILAGIASLLPLSSHRAIRYHERLEDKIDYFLERWQGKGRHQSQTNGIILGCLGACLIYFKTLNLGLISVILSFLMGVVIFWIFEVIGNID